MNITRKLDKLGRIVLPVDFREILGLEYDSEVRMACDGSRIIIEAGKPSCRLCGATNDLSANLPLCRACINKARNESA